MTSLIISKIRSLSLFTVLFVIGCTSTNPVKQGLSPVQLGLLNDKLFPAPEAGFIVEEAPDFLQLPENYRKELERQILPLESEVERYRALRRWVYRKFEDFDFDSTATYSLTELNNNRKLNCLSFSVLFVAAARYVNVPADFQLVFAPPYWDKQNNSWINNQHINVTGLLGASNNGSVVSSRLYMNPGLITTLQTVSSSTRFRYIADINPAILSVRIRREIIDEQHVLSLFYSNKGIENLLQENIAIAYQYTKAALIAYPDSALAWNNLGVLYNRVSQPKYAMAAFEQAIEVDEGAMSAKSNLARLYGDQGLEDLAAALQEEVGTFRNHNPYYHSALAEEYFTEGDFGEAKAQLQSAINRKRNEFYFYHQLARVNQQLGDMDSVMENLRLARRYARGEDRSRFSGKLRQLEELLTTR